MRLQGPDRLPEEACSAANPRPVRQPSRLRHSLRSCTPFQSCAVSYPKLPASLPALRMFKRGALDPWRPTDPHACGSPSIASGQAATWRAEPGDARSQGHPGGNRRGAPHPRWSRSSRRGGRAAGLLRLPAPHLHAPGCGPRVRGHRALGATSPHLHTPSPTGSQPAGSRASTACTTAPSAGSLGASAVLLAFAA